VSGNRRDDNGFDCRNHDGPACLRDCMQ
jgi:hypothetical protein